MRKCKHPEAIKISFSSRFVQSELERTQNRLQRCVMDCNDTIKDKVPQNPSENEIAKYTSLFERCAVKCVDSTIELLPALFKSMKSVLEKEAWKLTLMDIFFLKKRRGNKTFCANSRTDSHFYKNICEKFPFLLWLSSCTLI